MNKLISGWLLLAMASSAHAFDEKDASALVKKYSTTIACQLPSVLEDSGDQEADSFKNEYKAVKVNPGDLESGGLGAMFLVHWSGDIGCYGGNGTVTHNFTVVEHRGFITTSPVVITEYAPIALDIEKITHFQAKKGGLVIVEGVDYGENDQQYQPTKRVAYTLQFKVDKFVVLPR